jgi:hypothetical protein
VTRSVCGSVYRSLIASGIACLPAASAAAQSVLKGRIVADSGKRPIAAAEVVIAAPSRIVRSDADGRFTLGDLPAGRLAIRIRAVGFKPLDLEAEIGTADTVAVDFQLMAAPQQLAPLVVKENAAPRLSAKMEVFESRRRMGFGTFLDRAQLAKWENHSVSDAMRRTANLMLVARSFACGGGFAATTGRGGGQREPCVDPNTPRCYLAVYLDGLLLWAPGMGPPPDVDQFQADRLQGVEVYVGPGQLPAELQQTGTICGAVVFWTRTGER